MECNWHYIILNCENSQQLHCSWNIRKVKSVKTKDAALQTVNDIPVTLKSVVQFHFVSGKQKNLLLTIITQKLDALPSQGLLTELCVWVLQNLTECKFSEKSWWKATCFGVSMFKSIFFFIWMYFEYKLKPLNWSQPPQLYPTSSYQALPLHLAETTPTSLPVPGFKTSLSLLLVSWRNRCKEHSCLAFWCLRCKMGIMHSFDLKETQWRCTRVVEVRLMFKTHWRAAPRNALVAPLLTPVHFLTKEKDGMRDHGSLTLFDRFHLGKKICPFLIKKRLNYSLGKKTSGYMCESLFCIICSVIPSQ